MEFLEMERANRSGTALICHQRGFVHTFAATGSSCGISRRLPARLSLRHVVI
jgi:hypothetical protein